MVKRSAGLIVACMYHHHHHLHLINQKYTPISDMIAMWKRWNPDKVHTKDDIIQSQSDDSWRLTQRVKSSEI